MDRREMLKIGVGFAVANLTSAMAQPSQAKRTGIPILDAHIHLFDPTRPGGVPWPFKTDTVLYKPALPARYEQVTQGLGVVGAIAVEASPLASDNDWVLQQAAGNTKIVGVVGNLIPGSPTFAAQLDRLHTNPLLVGIRYGNLWDRDLYADIRKPGFVPDLRRLASAGLTSTGLSLDSANPDARLIEALLALSQQVPELRIVIDHLPNATLPTEADALKQYWANLRALGQNPRVFFKLSEVPVRQGERLRTEPSFYREKLDALWAIFGEDRILFGSDWPNSDHIATYAETLGIVREYVAAKGPEASEKYFWKNSIAAYRWKPRRPDQSAL
jgi:predicted TIM-barrel fold metal-dependent hydrolase